MTSGSRSGAAGCWAAIDAVIAMSTMTTFTLRLPSRTKQKIAQRLRQLSLAVVTALQFVIRPSLTLGAIRERRKDDSRWIVFLDAGDVGPRKRRGSTTRRRHRILEAPDRKIAQT